MASESRYVVSCTVRRVGEIWGGFGADNGPAPAKIIELPAV